MAKIVVRNFSRHALSVDQLKALEMAFPADEPVADEPEAPFFKDAEDLGQKINGQVAALVAPWDMVLEAIAHNHIGYDTVLIAWRADQASRKRGRFACRGVRAFWIDESGAVTVTADIETEPTVEVDFSSGETFPYEG